MPAPGDALTTHSVAVQDGLWDAFHDIHMGECAGALAYQQRVAAPGAKKARCRAAGVRGARPAWLGCPVAAWLEGPVLTHACCRGAEMCAERLGIGREAQDEHAIASVERARAAVAAGAALQTLPPLPALQPRLCCACYARSTCALLLNAPGASAGPRTPQLPAKLAERPLPFPVLQGWWTGRLRPWRCPARAGR